MKARPTLALIGLAYVTIVTPGGAQAPNAPATLAPARADSRDIGRVVAQLDGDERAARAELDAIPRELERVRARLLARGRAYVKEVRSGLLPIGGGFEALVDHMARVERTRRALERDIAREAELTRTSAALSERLAKLKVERAPLDLQREAMDRARVALHEADERRAAFTRAFETSVRPTEHLAIYGAEMGPVDLDPREGFQSLKGRAPMPISGRAEVHRVRRRGAGGPGLELVAAAGATVRAIAPGRVAFADRYDDYGLTVLLDHGDRYYSVYGNLAGADVAVGQSVPAAARIGTAGSDERRGSLLYFEIRRGAETIDPAPWLGL